MPMTAAQYKVKFDNAAAKSEVGTGFDTWNTKPEAKAAWANVASGWAFLWVEKAMMDKHSITPSATANAYAAKCEEFLGKAETEASNPTNAPKAVAWSLVAMNYGYAWLELTRIETDLPE